MATVLLFHHALGHTAGIDMIAERLRQDGHEVHVPDLYGGVTFDSIDDGVAHAESVGFDVIIDRGVAAAQQVSGDLAVIGISLGVLPAQKLAQTHPGVIAAVLCSAAVPVAAFGDAWPATVAVELHLGAEDPWVEEDLDAARAIAAESGGSLHLHPTDRHLFLDASHDDHEPELAGHVLNGIVDFLDGAGRAT